MPAALTILSNRDIIDLLTDPSGNRREVKGMDWFISLIISVTANVISYYICKWPDGNGDNDKRA